MKDKKTEATVSGLVMARVNLCLYKEFAGRQVVCHKEHEYMRDDGVTTNTVESSFAVLKRGIMGIYHSVTKKHLPRYVNEFDFRWNTRKARDGDRIVAAVQGAQAKRLDYKTLTR